MGRTAFLFPGQGSQSVGMAGHLWSRREASDLLSRVDGMAGAPGLTALMDSGPEDLLTRTDNVQPAITAVSLATLRVLLAAGIRPDGAAGHSLGEYSALVSAGVVSEADALRLVRRRGELMQACADRSPGGMIAMIGTDRETAARIAAEASPDGLAGIANINSEGQVVLSGPADAVARAAEIARASGIRRIVPLKVSGAWHSPLMRDAAAGLVAEFEATSFSDPAIPVYANVTAEPAESGRRVRELLVLQITSPVLWADTMHRMTRDGFDTFVEVGPGTVLQGLLKGYGGVRVLGTGSAEALEASLAALA